MNFELTERALHRVNANISAGNERIRQQTERIREMQREGFDTRLALRVLAVLSDARDASTQHRDLILERINLTEERSRYKQPVGSSRESVSKRTP